MHLTGQFMMNRQDEMLRAAARRGTAADEGGAP
jgi:hypothetical protein